MPVRIPMLLDKWHFELNPDPVEYGYRNIKTKGWVVKQKTVEFWNTMAGTNVVGLVDGNITKNSSPAV